MLQSDRDIQYQEQQSMKTFQIQGNQNFQQSKQEVLNLKKEQNQENKTEEQKKISHKYRADIDGLRAIAILVVVIFHGWPDFMTGGYIGVDIFFVISGYLISGIIIDQTLKDKFSYLTFYERRIRRIYPALITVLITTMLLACYLFVSYDLQKTSFTAGASAAFGTNIQRLINKISYWDNFSKGNPLLHLWSLGVQQQFYIVWPCFITCIIKKFDNKILKLMIGFTILSFILNVYSVYVYPQFAFYFPVCRFWQMSIGGILVYVNITFINKYIINALSAVSICAILIIIWLIDQRSLFPGWIALVPTLSAAGIILAGPESLFNKYVLSSKPFVFIGKISYPLYLWHWVMIVYFRFLFPPSSKSILSNSVTPITIAVILSYLTYRFIQNPFRFHKSKNVVKILAIIMLVILFVSFFIAKNPTLFSYEQRKILRNFALYEKELIPQEQDYYIKAGRKNINSSKRKNRLPITQQKITFSRAFYDQRFNRPSTVTPSSKYWIQNLKSQNPTLDYYDVLNEGKQNQVFLIGDSHARVSWKQKKNNKTDAFPTVLFMGAKPFFLPCYKINDLIMQIIQKHKPQRIIFANWVNKYLQSGQLGCGSTLEPGSTFVDNLAQQMKKLIQMKIQVYVGDINPDGDRFLAMLMKDFNGVIQERTKPVKLSQFKEEASKWPIKGQYFSKTLTSVGVKMIQWTDNQCWQGICQVATPTGYPIFRDTNHYIEHYARYWLTALDPVIQF